jgi:SsrA-binding protein
MAKSPARGGKKPGQADITRNRQVAFRYELLDTYECGMMLTGTEVKSLRDGGAHLKDSYALLREGELWLIGAHIPPYPPAWHNNHDPDRDRKLLLHRRELDALSGNVKEKGLTLVPTRMYFRDSRAKIEIALARGKDLYDKRQAIKERDTKRDVDRAMREVGR